MEDERAGRLGRLDPLDRRAGVVARGVLAAGDDHGHRRARADADLRAAQVAGRGGGERPEQVAFEERQQRLRLRVAEPAVELQHPRPVGGQHQAGEEHADERRGAARELLEHGPVDPVDELLDLGRPEARDRRERPHPAGVRPRVAVADALVVAGGAERDRPFPVAQREDGELLALEQLLEDDRPVEALRRGERGGELLLPCGTPRRPCRR